MRFFTVRRSTLNVPCLVVLQQWVNPRKSKVSGLFDKISIIHGQWVIDLITSGVFSIASKPISKWSSSAPLEAKTLL